MISEKKLRGATGEQYVAEYVQAQGFSIIARNFYRSGGEIDIIGIKDDILAFIEVKTRSYHLVEPASLVPISKQKRIIKTAYAFIAHHNLVDKIYRFDIAFVDHNRDTLTLEYIENAFTDLQG